MTNKRPMTIYVGFGGNGAALFFFTFAMLAAVLGIISGRGYYNTYL